MTRTRDQFGNHDAQQHVRYVEVYTIDTPVDVTGATNAAPIEITATAHGFATGDKV